MILKTWMDAAAMAGEGHDDQRAIPFRDEDLILAPAESLRPREMLSKDNNNG